MVLNRISDPLSKRGVNEWLKEVYRPSFEQLELHHLYRSFVLADNALVRREKGGRENRQPLSFYEALKRREED